MKQELDFIKSQIFAIEDFESVDPSLLSEIDKNEEYRILFEECRSMSGNLKDAVPAPEKDGITLHSAVMDRVKCGDIQPRYIQSSSFKFPFATAACLLVVALVVLISRGNNFKYANDEALDYEIADENTVLFADNYSGDTEEASDNAVYFSTSEETDKNTAEKTRYNGTQIIAKNDSGSSAQPEVFQNSPAYDRYTPEEYKSYIKESQTEKSEILTHFAQNAEEESLTLDTSAGESALSPETLSKLEKASLLTGDETDRISKQDILLLGEDAFSDFFDSICESEDFAKLYTLENFKQFCKTRKQ